MLHPHILCLQDTHLQEFELPSLKEIWNGEIILAGGRSNARGVAIFLSNNFEYTINKIEKDEEGNFIIIDLVTNDISIQLINIYATNKDNPIFFKKLEESIENDESNYTLICGD